MAYLNMTDSSEQCPSSRACGRSSTAHMCYSTIYIDPVTRSILKYVEEYLGTKQDHLMPLKIIYYRRTNINGVYMDGVSVTHGLANTRQHIWSFVGSFYFQDPDYQPRWNCRCTNTLYSWPYQIPPFLEINISVIVLTEQPKTLTPIPYGMAMDALQLVHAVN